MSMRVSMCASACARVHAYVCVLACMCSGCYYGCMCVHVLRLSHINVTGMSGCVSFSLTPLRSLLFPRAYKEAVKIIKCMGSWELLGSQNKNMRYYSPYTITINMVCLCYKKLI